MEHAEALELIELAAVEPDGLERLMAGDTPESGAVAGHLAGCPACVAELARIRRTAAVARRVIATSPDPALRERTLAFVREVGRDRTEAAREPEPEPAAPRPVDVPAPPATPSPPPRPRWLRWGALAAALVLAAGLGFGFATARSEESRLAYQLSVLAYQLSVLERAGSATIRLGAAPDARWVPLTATDAGDGATGTVLVSPSTGELLMIAEGLTPLAEDEEYRCWMVADGTRYEIGALYPVGEIYAWAATFADMSRADDAEFGVSLAPAGGGAWEPVLTGGG